MHLDREIEIVHDLAQRVLRFEELLNTCSDICGELDWCESLVGERRMTVWLN